LAFGIFTDLLADKFVDALEAKRDVADTENKKIAFVGSLYVLFSGLHHARNPVRWDWGQWSDRAQLALVRDALCERLSSPTFRRVRELNNELGNILDLDSISMNDRANLFILWKLRCIIVHRGAASGKLPLTIASLSVRESKILLAGEEVGVIESSDSGHIAKIGDCRYQFSPLPEPDGTITVLVNGGVARSLKTVLKRVVAAVSRAATSGSDLSGAAASATSATSM